MIRKCSIIISTLFFMTEIYGQALNKKKIDYYQAGAVKCEVIYDKNNNIIDKTEYSPYGKPNNKELSFYIDKRISEKHYYSGNKISFKIRYDYNRKGEIIKESWLNSTNNLNQTITYLYDKFGNKIEEKTFSPSDSLTFVRRYKYDNKSCVEECGFLPKGTISYKVEYSYNENHKLSEERKYENSDSIPFVIDYIYDSQGKLVSEYYDGDRNHIKQYKYNDAGFQAEVNYFFSGELISSTQNTYFSDGIHIKEILEKSKNVSHVISFQIDGLKSAELYYRGSKDSLVSSILYDVKGNKIEEVNYDNGFFDYKLTNKYDSIGNNIESNKLYSDGHQSKWVYSYDNSGRKTGWRLYGECNQLWTIVEIQYDDKNNSISNVINYKEGSPVESNIMVVEHNKELSRCIETNYYKNGLVFCKKIFNNKGKETEVFYYKNGIIDSKYIYTYNNEVEDVSKYEYDNNGLLISKDAR